MDVLFAMDPDVKELAYLAINGILALCGAWLTYQMRMVSTDVKTLGSKTTLLDKKVDQVHKDNNGHAAELNKKIAELAHQKGKEEGRSERTEHDTHEAAVTANKVLEVAKVVAEDVLKTALEASEDVVVQVQTRTEAELAEEKLKLEQEKEQNKKSDEEKK